MKLNSISHLCYSLNIFPKAEEGYIATIRSLIPKMCKLRRELNLSDTTPFALGLWLDSGAVKELGRTANIVELKRLLSLNNFYVFTLNAFPYGSFHGDTVKERVYLPDWTSKLRSEFTSHAADILTELLPEGLIGSISTLPGAYRYANKRADLTEIGSNLSECAEHLADIERRYGKKIILGIEMEPDCIWETPQEFCEFRRKYLTSDAAEQFIGVCYDTSHQELIEGLPGSGLYTLLDAEVPIAKVQLSTALRSSIKADLGSLRSELASFADPVYLHQTRIMSSEKKILNSFRDLPELLISGEFKELGNSDRLLVSHFHLPIFLNTISSNFATASEEMDKTLEIIKQYPEICSNIEIETYTYSVLPHLIKPESREKMMLEEYRYVLGK